VKIRKGGESRNRNKRVLKDWVSMGGGNTTKKRVTVKKGQGEVGGRIRRHKRLTSGGVDRGRECSSSS